MGTQSNIRERSRPGIPLDLEQVVLSRGPRVLRWLISKNGGFVKAAKAAKVATPTLSRWVRPIGGNPKADYRSLWAGYPSPFPALDRAVEELIGPEHSFVGALVELRGWDAAWELIRFGGPFGLITLGLESVEIREACMAVGIPNTTRRRMVSGTSYPSQWKALDRLAQKAMGTNWVEAVLTAEVHDRPRRIPSAALCCLIGEIQGGALSPGGAYHPLLDNDPALE